MNMEKNKMYSTSAILGLLTETSLHAGAGQTLGVIDLPIQREAHTHWPCVYGSAVKGALRARAESAELPDIDLIFGPPPPKSGDPIDYAGALSVGDARLLLLPVRSLTTHFRWVTCPAALQRFRRDVERLGLKACFASPHPAPLQSQTVSPGAPETPFQSQTVASARPVPEREGENGRSWLEIPALDGDTALVAEAVNGRPLFLEEYRFETKTADLTAVIDTLAKLLPDGLEEPLKKQLTVVSNDHFRYLAEHATPVNAHVRLTENKTVANRALWYEETLPPETLLYVGLNAVDARRNGAGLKAADVLARIRQNLFGPHPYLQLGGNETVGMGWCRTAFITGSEG
ncbi:type III-B CRISPR module RAMP protein Cmr4 [Methylocaldum szegediense]|uniref:type III-B CRISPR module RAMP protein Cmr4 n=1 Tax=Methylocaldum szegediense TaxID=73780 RepID=UPI00041341F9|nr:type III-B CRISPR module RAMP protein Cmr4 [Methylocaldum szegediense]